MKRGSLELIDYAIYFATKAHNGQKRKSDKEVDMIFHPYTVAMMIQRAGGSDEAVIAGLLHDVVEDTPYNLDDIKNEFGDNIASVVSEVSEKKELEWEERKQEAMDRIKNASIDGKLVECADKISNLETMYNLYEEIGDEIWNSFKRPKDKQKWYYTEMYKAVIENTTEDNILFERYKNILEKLF